MLSAYLFKRFVVEGLRIYANAVYAVFLCKRALFGIPVATVAINGGLNAGLLAAKILAVSDGQLLGKLKDYSSKMKEQVQAKDAKLQESGYRNYGKA